MFDPGGSEGRLRACPFLGTWRALLCGEVMRVGAAGGGLQGFWRIDDSVFKNFQKWYRRIIYAVHIAVNRWFFTARPTLNIPCQDKGIPSRAARGDRKSGANVCRGVSWSEQLDAKELRGALVDERDNEPRGSPFSEHRLHGQPTLFHLLQCGMLIPKYTSYCCNVPDSTVVPHITL